MGVLFHPTLHHALASISLDGTCRVWDVRDPDRGCVVVLDAQSARVRTRWDNTPRGGGGGGGAAVGGGGVVGAHEGALPLDNKVVWGGCMSMVVV